MFIAYIKNSEHSWQMSNLQNITITKKKNEVDTANFSVVYAENFEKEMFQEGNEIIISEISGNTEKIYFSGIIAGFKADLEGVEIHAFSELYILKRRVYVSPKNYQNMSLSHILYEMQAEINLYDTGRIRGFDVDFQKGFTANFSRGKSIFDALKELAGDIYSFDFKSGILSFQENPGTHRTEGENFLLFEYNTKNFGKNNIAKIQVHSDIASFSNFIVGKEINASNGESKGKYGLWMESSDQKDVDKELAEKHVPLWEFSVEPSDINFFDCDIDDVVRVIIDTNNPLLAFNGSLRVTEKTFKSGGLNNVTIKLSTGKSRQKNIFETISELKSSVRDLKITK